VNNVLVLISFQILYMQDSDEPFPSPDADMDDRFDSVDGYLFLSLGFNSKQNAWAGPDHWKYRKSKGAVWVSDKNLNTFIFFGNQYGKLVKSLCCSLRGSSYFRRWVDPKN